MPDLYINSEFFIMAEKKSFVLRLDKKHFEALEKWSADEFRSINGQLEYIIAKALKDHKRIRPKNNE